MKIFFIGIGGIGMSGLAEYMLEKGNVVFGSDSGTSVITDRLAEKGAVIYTGHDKNNITGDIDLVVYSSAISEANPELTAAREKSIKTVKRAGLLGEIVNGMFLIAVSGTHGKTSTTAMIAKMLIDAELDPTVFAGGTIDFLNGAAVRLGAGKIAVVEADEYDRSFLTLTPDIAIVNNIEEDHLDIYKDIDDIKYNFIKFVNQSKEDAAAVLNGDDENVHDIINNIKTGNIIRFGISEGNDVYSSDIKYNPAVGYASEFNIISRGINKGSVQLKVQGIHNIKNSLAAYCVSEKFEIPFEVFAKSISHFTPVKRRLELVYSKGINIFDDYAHHPTEIRNSLEGIKLTAGGRIITVFQPHLYTRTRDFYHEFAKSLAISDVLILTEIYPAREEKIEGVSSELIADEYEKIKGEKPVLENDPEKINSILKNIVKEGDTIVFQGAGSITLYCQNFVKSLY